MKNTLILAIALAMPLTAIAADEAIMLEIGVGFGQSGRVVKTAKQLANPFNNKFCFHRPASRMVYGAVRYRYNDAEAHVARWFNSTDTARCDRNSWGAGVGYVLDTQNINGNNGSGNGSTDDVYATYTPGIAYTWGKNKDFNTQDNTNTNWRLKDNWQMYNRLAVGTGGNNSLAEVAVVRYGNIIVDDYERTGENFMTLTAGYRDYDKNGKGNNSGNGGGGTDPSGPVTIIIEDNTVAAPPSAPVAPQTPPQDQTNGGTFNF